MAENGNTAGQGKLGVLLSMYDFPVMNVGLRAIIDAEADMHVIGEAVSRESMLRHLDQGGVDVVIMESLLQKENGRTSIEALEAVRSAGSDAKVLALAWQSSEHFSLALKAGADGFLTRGAEPADIVSAIRCLGRSETYVSPSIVTRMVNTYLLKVPSGGAEDPYDLLTDREKEVLLLVAIGHTNKEIATIFNLSIQTVHNHRARLMEKLGFHDRVELLKYAFRRRLVNADEL